MAAIEHVKGSVTKFAKPDAELEGTASLPDAESEFMAKPANIYS